MSKFNEKFDILRAVEGIGKIIPEASMTDEEVKKVENKEIWFMDGAYVMGIIPKTPLLKAHLVRNHQPEEKKKPELKYEVECKFSVEYLANILSFLKKSKIESVMLKMKKDYPITLETDEMDIILAPRVEGM